MIRGTVIDLSPYVEVIVIGNRGLIDIVALVDTGFNGSLCLPMEVGAALGLEIQNMARATLADGTVKLEFVFGAQLDWDGELRFVDVVLTGSDEALIGTRLLEGKSLKVDFRTEEVIIA